MELELRLEAHKICIALTVDSLNKAFASTSTVRTEKSEKSYADVSEKLAASQARQLNPERLHLSQ